MLSCHRQHVQQTPCLKKSKKHQKKNPCKKTTKKEDYSLGKCNVSTVNVACIGGGLLIFILFWISFNFHFASRIMRKKYQKTKQTCSKSCKNRYKSSMRLYKNACKSVPVFTLCINPCHGFVIVYRMYLENLCKLCSIKAVIPVWQINI